MAKMQQEHITHMGSRKIRQTDGSVRTMPFTRCLCGWEGPSRARRSRAVEDGFDHILEMAAKDQATGR
jgi:hypothetical protein